ncbi:hypothetical protein D3C87_1672740 [compost metagenome]
MVSPRLNVPLISRTPAGNRLLPERSASSAPASMESVPAGSSCPAIQVLRAVTGEPDGANQDERAPSSMAASGWFGLPEAMIMAQPAVVAILPASILVRMPPRDSSEAAPPAMASISGVISAIVSRKRALGSRCGGAV